MAREIQKEAKRQPCQKSAGLLLYLARKEYFHSCHLFPISKKDHALLIGLPICWMIFAMMPTSAKEMH